jgi:uncharacterized protein (DUF1778 family)
LAGQNRFVLSGKKWLEFQTALDAPAKQIPALRRLLSNPPVFDKP